MEMIPMDVTLISATGLKDVNLLSKMDVYAVVSMSGMWAQEAKQRTPVDKDSGPNPKWNHTARFVVPEAQAGQLTLNVKLVSDRSFGDKEIGEVNIPLKDLLDAETGAEKRLSYTVRIKNGKYKGTLQLSYRLGEKYAAPAPKAAPEPAPAYAYPPMAPGPSHAPAPAYPYPAPQPGYAYPMPQQAGYGYPAGQPGYGYPMAAPKPHKPKRGGGNMALGLGAGLLGGLLIGDMVSDVASYDAGFDDAGFDF